MGVPATMAATLFLPGGRPHRQYRPSRSELTLARSETRRKPWRIQPVDATTAASASDGVIQPRVCRGRPFSSAAMASRVAWVKGARSMPFGRYWRRRPRMLQAEALRDLLGRPASQQEALDLGGQAR